jgi:hypothetical protein
MHRVTYRGLSQQENRKDRKEVFLTAMFLASTCTCAVYVKRWLLFTGLAKNMHMANFSKKSLTLN